LVDLQRTVYSHKWSPITAAGQVRDRESSPVKYRRSATVPRNDNSGNVDDDDDVNDIDSEDNKDDYN